jgi:hypothetical protein
MTKNKPFTISQATTNIKNLFAFISLRLEPTFKTNSLKGI